MSNHRQRRKAKGPECITLQTLRKGLGLERRQSARGRPFGIALQTLRKGLGLTQAAVAKRAFLAAGQIGHVERTDLDHLYVSTLRKHVEALGCRLELWAVFEDGRRVLLSPNAVWTNET